MSNTRDEEIIGTGDHTRRPRNSVWSWLILKIKQNDLLFLFEF